MKTHCIQAPLRWLAAFVTTAVLAGCGFHLRGAQDVQLDQRLSPMLITGLGTADPLYGVLSAAISQTGTRVTRQPAEAGSVLLLSARENRRRVVAVDRAGFAVEYDVVEGVTFELLDRNRDTLVPEQRIEVDRSYTDAEGDPLGKTAERAALRATAREDLSQQIVRRLRHGTR
jgi:LPS-assembly lipoprotein